MEIPHVHMHRDVGVAEAAPEQAQHFAPVCRTFLLHLYTPLTCLVSQVQDNHGVIYDNGAHLPVVRAATPLSVNSSSRPVPDRSGDPEDMRFRARSPWLTLTKLFPVSRRTQPHLLTCQRTV